MATPGTTKALSLTFGVEIELLMPWLFLDQKDSHEHTEGLPPAFRVDRERVKRNAYGTDNPVYAAAEIIFNDFRDTLERLGLASSLTESHSQDDGYSALVLEGHQDWEIQDDGSLHLQESLGYEEKYPSYGLIQQWVSLEIQSPAEYATPEAFKAIKYALQVLTQKYRMRPIPEHSNMARGVEAEPAHAGDAGSYPITWDCLGYLGADVRHGEEPITWREENRKKETIEAFEKTRQPFHSEPFIQGGDSSSSSRSCTVSQSGPSRRGNKSNSMSSLQGGRVNQRGSPSDLEEAVSISAGPVKSPPQGDSSYQHESTRTRELPKIALPRYTATELQELAGRLYRGTGFRVYWRTIEFRMGEGCLDDWVGTWAAICVGFVHFAMYAPVEEYLKVLTCCDLAAKQDGSYDVPDLLDDLYLFEEAEIAEKRVLQYSKDWDVTFVG
ncbi:hypothetical protein DL764_002748 [Monosporascus ibericus]|uniref:Uncharacterized protein n=1 Tax=Monosporascus ibericus TaxID=155417 RepID=A0A4Q4TJB2_9PEZI|nr:hypothetical protein DL764_002748 [Monosporascus ibericus]